MLCKEQSTQKTSLQLNTNFKKLKLDPYWDFSAQESELKPAKNFYSSYNKIKRLGAGCSSTVKLYSHKRTKEQIAAKFVRTRNQELVLRQQEEFEVLQYLKNEHLPRYYDLYYDERRGISILTMEYIEGMTLSEWIHSEEVLCLSSSEYAKQIKKIITQLLQAILFLHQNGVVHRDIKPDNIIIQRNGPAEGWAVKLIDFNVAKFENEFHPGRFDASRRNGNFCMSTNTGTLAYKAPEICGGSCYSEMVDLWSCGCVLYFLMKKKAPFEAEYAGELIEKICKEEIEICSELKEKYQQDCIDLLKNLLAKDPERRITAYEALTGFWIKKAPEGQLRQDFRERDFSFQVETITIRRKVSSTYK